MKKTALLLFGILMFLMLAPTSSFAQSDPPPPPPCCGGNAPSVHRGEVSTADTTIESQITVSRTLLAAQGITRSQFVDRISESFFAGKRVDLMYTASRLVRPIANERRTSMSAEASDSEEGLVAVQEKRIYQVARDSMSSEAIEKLDQLYITDGVVFIKITFQDETPPAEQ